MIVVFHGSGAAEGLLKDTSAMNPGTNDYVPTWSGEASQFEAYATACKWFQKATKESERKLIVARLWGRLTGVAKSVVRHLDPDSFEGEDGLSKFLDVLRRSPLQQLPISDSFSRLEKWNSLRRQERETIAELIIREEELFIDLQQALTRARSDRVGTTFLSAGRGSTSPVSQTAPDASPSQSPIAGARRNSDGDHGSSQRDASGNAPASISTDFFSDEMRGYRLLKASRLTANERQNILVQTGNSTQFYAIRRALRTLFAEDGERQPQRQGARIWWAEHQWHGDPPRMPCGKIGHQHPGTVGLAVRMFIGMTGHHKAGQTTPGKNRLGGMMRRLAKNWSPMKLLKIQKSQDLEKHQLWQLRPIVPWLKLEKL